jgi:hypothetical protein
VTDVISGENAVEPPDRQGVVRLYDLDEQLIGQLVNRARSEGLRLTGEKGLLAQLTKRTIESAGGRCRHMGTFRSLDPKGTGQTKWAMRWKPALNALAVTFADRMPAAEEPRTVPHPWRRSTRC